MGYYLASFFGREGKMLELPLRCENDDTVINLIGEVMDATGGVTLCVIDHVDADAGVRQVAVVRDVTVPLTPPVGSAVHA